MISHIRRNKLAELEQRLNRQLGDDRLVALQELDDRKNEEMESLKSGWEEQIKQLSGQVGCSCARAVFNMFHSFFL